MTFLDIIIIALILIPAFLGYKRGFFRELVESIGAVVGAILSYRFYPSVSKLVNIQLDSPSWMIVATYLGLFVVIMIIFSIISRMLRHFAESISLGTYEHIAGFLLGALKGGILAAVLAVALIWSGGQGEKLVADSRMTRANLLVFHNLSKALPDKWYQKYQKIAGDLSQMAEKKADGFLPLNLLTASSNFDLGYRLSGKLTDWNSAKMEGVIQYEWEGHNCAARLDRRSFAGDSSLAFGFKQGETVNFNLGYFPDTGEIIAISLGIEN